MKRTPAASALVALAAAGCVALLAVALLAVALACGGSRPKAAASAPAPAAAETREEPRAQIEALEREIAGDMARANVAQPAIAPCTGPACAAAMSTPFATPTTIDAVCHPAQSQRCKDVCTLSTSICNNQQKICDLARQLVGDDWAANKCESARGSCKAANESCCTCTV
ncbi:MAG TPA: hypothetical protein VLM79_11960 [Kofleriaceae bacterium]|nr:hypothetical protein [Kofleriaceae bacterium]